MGKLKLALEKAKGVLGRKFELYGVDDYRPKLITVDGNELYRRILGYLEIEGDPKYDKIVRFRNKIRTLKSSHDKSELIRYFNTEFSLDKNMLDKSGPGYQGTGPGTAWMYYEKPDTY